MCLQATPGASPVWALPSGLALTYQQLEGEARVGGVYCRCVLVLFCPASMVGNDDGLL